MKVVYKRSFNANQPHRQFSVYEVGGVEVTVKMGGNAQTWDCKTFYSPTRIVGGPNTPEVRTALKKAFPQSAKLAELEE